MQSAMTNVSTGGCPTGSLSISHCGGRLPRTVSRRPTHINGFAPCAYTSSSTADSVSAACSTSSRPLNSAATGSTGLGRHSAHRGPDSPRRFSSLPTLRGGLVSPLSSAATDVPSLSADAGTVAAAVTDEAKAVGCLLGAMCGNVLAAPYEGDRHYQVVRARPNGVTDFWRFDIGRQALQYGQYTGDFGNLLAVARSLVDDRGLTTEGLLDALLSSFDPATRRYSPYDRTVGEAILSGTQPSAVPQLAERFLADTTRRHASTSSDSIEREPYGPSDYCAAARAAPIGIAYRSAGGRRLLAAVRRSLVFSHATPLGLDAAHVVAAAAAWCARQQPADGVVCRPDALLTHLINDVAVTAEMVGKLRLLRDNLFQIDEVTDWRSFYKGPQWFALSRLLTQMSFHGYATAGSEFAAVALLAFLTSWGRPEQAVVVAASFGGHGAATAQVVGALAGALHGWDWVPARWFRGLENGATGDGGRDRVMDLGRGLAEVQLAELQDASGEGSR